MSVYGSLAVDAIILFGVACGAPPVPTTEAASNMTNLTIEDNGRIIDLAVGATITLTLKSIPGTGYSWEVVESAAGHISRVGEPEPAACPDDEVSGEIGGPSCQVFRFKAEKAGSGSLKLHYKRRWEKAAPPEKTFTVELRIQ